jgi:hypothetical protein
VKSAERPPTIDELYYDDLCLVIEVDADPPRSSVLETIGNTPVVRLSKLFDHYGLKSSANLKR